MVEVTLAWWLAQQPSLVGVHVEELMCELVALEAETAKHLWQKQIVFHETSHLAASRRNGASRLMRSSSRRDMAPLPHTHAVRVLYASVAIWTV